MRKFNDSELIGHSLNFINQINNKNTTYLGDMHKFRNSQDKFRNLICTIYLDDYTHSQLT